MITLKDHLKKQLKKQIRDIEKALERLESADTMTFKIHFMPWYDDDKEIDFTWIGALKDAVEKAEAHYKKSGMGAALRTVSVVLLGGFEMYVPEKYWADYLPEED